MTNIKVSIIVPIYNTERYLKQCIESLLNQTYENIEVIIIDDQSTDNTTEIMKEMQNKDKRIRCIYNKTNIGAYLSRKSGLKISTGNYLMFIDADDWIEKNTIEVLIKKIKKYNADLIKYRMIFEPSKKKSDRIIENNKDEVLITPKRKKNIYDLLIRTSKLNNLANEIIKRELITVKKKNLRVSQGEDALQNYEIFTNANRILITSDCLYHYRLNENSTTNILNKDRIVKNIEDILIVYSYKLQYMKIWNCFEEKSLKTVALNLNTFLTEQLLKLYRIKNITDKEIEVVYKKIYDNNIYIEINKNITAKDINDKNILKKIIKRNVFKQKINKNNLLKFFIIRYYKMKEMMRKNEK